MTVTKNSRVEDIMSTDLITVNKNQNLHIVEEKFDKYGIHHLPVMDNGKIVGMISQGDLLIMKDWGTNLNLRRSLKKNQEILRTHTAEDIMSQKIVSVKLNTTIQELAHLLKQNNIHAFPVIKFGELVGIVSTYDIIQKTFS